MGAILEPFTVVELQVDNRSRADLSFRFKYERDLARLTLILVNKGEPITFDRPLEIKGN